MNMETTNKEKNNLVFRPVIFEIGWRISLPLIFMVLAGNWLDQKAGTKPLFVLFSILLSLFTSAYGINQTIKKYTK